MCSNKIGNNYVFPCHKYLANKCVEYELVALTHILVAVMTSKRRQSIAMVCKWEVLFMFTCGSRSRIRSRYIILN